MGQVVWWGCFEGVGLEAEGAAYATCSAVTCGEDVDVGIADHDGFGGSDGFTCDYAGLRNKSLKPVGIGLFGVEAVSAVVLKEEL